MTSNFPLVPSLYKTKGNVRGKNRSVLRSDGKWEDTGEPKIDRATGLPIWLVGVVWTVDDGWGGQDVQNGWVEIAAAEVPVVKPGLNGDSFTKFEITVYGNGGVTLRAKAVS
jgi:hypothetical protein